MPERRSHGKRRRIIEILRTAQRPLTSHEIGARLSVDPCKATWSAYVPLQALVAEGIVRKHGARRSKGIGYALTADTSRDAAGRPSTSHVDGIDGHGGMLTGAVARAIHRRAEIMREIADIDRFLELHAKLFESDGRLKQP